MGLRGPQTGMHDDAQARAAATYHMGSQVSRADGCGLLARRADAASDLQQLYRPWERVAEPDLLRALFPETGAAILDVVAELGARPRFDRLKTGGPWFWAPATGGTIEQMSDEDQALVKRECLEFIGASAVSSVEANVVYAIATTES